MQWMIGPPICVLGLWGFWYEMTYVPQPDEPKKAIWVTLILFVVTIVLNELLRPKPNLEDARPAGLGDFQFPTATEGRVVPLIFGRVRQKGPNVVWYGDLVQEAITEKVKTGLWSSERITKGFRYNVGVQFAISRGSDNATVALRRVWVGDVEVFSGNITTNTFFDINEPDLFGGDDLGNGGLTATCDFYIGTTTQAVNAYLDDPSRQQIAQATNPDTAPRYTGTCYVVARNLTSAGPVATDQGAYLGNSTQVKPWSFEVERFPALFGGQTGTQNRVGSAGDCNPINVVYELLTNKEWGFGFPATDIDVGTAGVNSFNTAEATMRTEGNGFAWLLDRQIAAKDMLQEIQRQIDGVVYLSQTTGKWTVKLARGDYTVGTLPALDDSNVAEVRDFTRGSWEDTTNTIQVQYDKRADDYKQSFAVAIDTANALIQGDGTLANAAATTGKLAFPGVKDSTLASNLAWRELRGQSYPLARATLIVNRQMWDLNIGDVVRWTNTRLGFTDLPVRITRIDYGRLQDNKMSLTVVQDVFRFAAASFGDPPATGWTPPVTSLVAFPADEQLAMETPRGIIVRDPDFAGDATITKVFCAARKQGGEVAFDITQRNAAGVPGGSYADAGTAFTFTRIGELTSALDAGVASPTSTITVTPTPDSQTNIEAAFDDNATLTDLGVDFAQLIYVGTDDSDGEFMLVADAADNASNVDLQNVYRGVMDTAQRNHPSGTPVWLVHLGARSTTTNFPNTNNVDIELRMRSSSTRFAGSVTSIGLTMDKRSIRPYAPGAVRYNSSGTDFNTPDVEADGGPGENALGFDVDWTRRRFDTADELQELLADFSVDASTEYQVRVFVDPDGANTEIASSPFAWQTGSGTIQVLRNELQDIDAAGTEIRVQIQARHDIGSETNLTSRTSMIHDVVPTSANDGLFYLGGNIGTGPSNAYVVASAGVHTIDIGASASGGNAEYRINGGSWLTITAGGTATASLAISDTIEVRYSTGGVTPDPNFVWIDNPSATRVAYGCL